MEVISKDYESFLWAGKIPEGNTGREECWTELPLNNSNTHELYESRKTLQISVFSSRKRKYLPPIAQGYCGKQR